MLEKAKRLSLITNDRDILEISSAQFPGPHCPLFGAIMTASYVDDLSILIIGTEECTYYGKDFAIMRQNGKDNVFSAVLEHHDITFGCEDDLRKIITEIDDIVKPKALMVITTCVIELIGDDVVSIVNSMKDHVSMKLMTVKTEHFKCNSHIDGMKRAFKEFEALLLPKNQSNNTVNILGFKYDDVEKTELYQALVSNEIQVQMVIPSKVCVDEFEVATKACLNIVVDDTALDLAKAMEMNYNISYVEVGIKLDLKDIDKAYGELDHHLKINILKQLEPKRVEVLEKIQKIKANVKGKSFIYGNTPFDCFDFSLFLVSLGMVPKIIQCRELLSIQTKSIEMLLSKGVDPYVIRMANIAPLRRIYDDIKPNYYFGHESPMVLAKHKITQIVLDKAAKKIGYEKIIEVIDSIEEERDMFSLMGKPVKKNSEVKDRTKEIKERIKRMTNLPKPMKMMILDMPSIPMGMQETLMKMDINSSGAEFMKGRNNRKKGAIS